MSAQHVSVASAFAARSASDLAAHQVYMTGRTDLNSPNWQTVVNQPKGRWKTQPAWDVHLTGHYSPGALETRGPAHIDMCFGQVSERAIVGSISVNYIPLHQDARLRFFWRHQVLATGTVGCWQAGTVSNADTFTYYRKKD